MSSQKLSYFKLTGISIGNTIASGAFSLSGDMAAGGAGTGAVLTGWTICGIGMLALTLCFFSLNKIRPELTGGIYSYAKEGYGDYAGFNSAWGFWVSALLSNVSFATLLFAAVGHFLPVFGEGNNVLSIIAASILIWATVALVLKGVEEAAAITMLVTFAKLIPIAVFAVTIVFFKAFDPDIFLNNFFGEDTGLTFTDQIKATTYTTAWTFVGIEGAVAISGRAKRSGDVGKATVTSFLAVLIIYILISVLSMGVMSREELASQGNPPMAGILASVVGPWGALVINLGVIVSLLGATLGHTILASECAFQAAEKGSFCKAFTYTNKNGSPWFSLLVTNIIIQAFLIILYFNQSTYQIFYTISTCMIVVPYLLSAMYYLKLTAKEPQMLADKKINRVGAYIIATAGTVYGLWLFYSGGVLGIVISALLYAPGTFVYIKGCREEKKPAFTGLRDVLILTAIAVLFIVSVILMIQGNIKLF